jgi:hypothetical protein
MGLLFISHTRTSEAALVQLISTLDKPRYVSMPHSLTLILCRAASTPTLKLVKFLVLHFEEFPLCAITHRSYTVQFRKGTKMAMLKTSLTRNSTLF